MQASSSSSVSIRMHLFNIYFFPYNNLKIDRVSLKTFYIKVKLIKVNINDDDIFSPCY